MLFQKFCRLLALILIAALLPVPVLADDPAETPAPTPAPTIDGERQLNARALYAYPLGVVAGVLCLLLLIALLMSLLDWLNQDISSTFATLRTHFQ